MKKKLYRQVPVTDGPLGTDLMEILRGLNSGEYKRHGGTIRKAPGRKDGGEIVGFLRDTGINGRALSELSPVGTKTLSATFQLSQVAAAASMLNLGVSVVGFAYMAKRMNDLQRDLHRLAENMDRRFDRVEDKLDVVLHRLEEVRYLIIGNRVQGEALRDEIRALRQAFLGRQKAELMAALETVEVGESRLEDYLLRFKEVRGALEEELLQPAPFSDSARLLDVGVRLRVWTVAAGAESLALVRLGKVDHAAEQYIRNGEKAHEFAREWVRRGLPEADWSIWAHRLFDDSVSEERLDRLSRTLEGERPLAEILRKEGRGAVGNDAYVTALSDESKRLHEGLAALTDGAVEVGDRLRSNAMELEYTSSKGIPVDEWQQAGKEHDRPVVLIPSHDQW